LQLENLPDRSGKWRRRKSLYAAGLALAVLLLAFRDQVLNGLGEFLVVSDPLEHADLIYVLAGDFWGSRVLLGASLGSQHWAPKVIFSGGRYMDSFACDLSVDFAVQHGYARQLFVPIRLVAKSTIGEAREMGPIFHRMGARRIILVTSNFHSRRAAQVFRLLLPEFDFRVEASSDPAFDPHSWWRNGPARSLLFSEYQKMLGTILVKFHLARSEWLRQAEA
jgi:uncharacterized SAM-binding protein YcdF (DUF218 family)